MANSYISSGGEYLVRCVVRSSSLFEFLWLEYPLYISYWHFVWKAERCLRSSPVIHLHSEPYRRVGRTELWLGL